MAAVLRLLGVPRIEIDGVAHLIGNDTGSVLFAALLGRAGESVHADSLGEALWGFDPPATAAASLRGHVTRLRRRLAELGCTAEIATHVSRRGSGYALMPRLDIVDHLSLVDGLRKARGLADDGDHRAAARLLESELHRWAGDPFEGLDVDAFRATQRRLVATRLDAVELLGELSLGLNEHTRVAPLLTDAARQHPEREHLTALAMRALYRGGRQRDALDTFQHTRGWLAEHMGLDPTAELRRLEQSILLHHTGLIAPASASSASSPLPSALSSQLRGPFVGRETEVDAVLTRLADIERRGSIEVITGPAGVGKSRLVAELAAHVHRPDITVVAGWCRAEAPTAFHLIEPVIARLASVRPDLESPCETLLAAMAPSVDAPRRSESRLMVATDRLAEAIAARPQSVVLVLDDLHWIDSSSELLLARLFRSAPSQLTVIAAGRDDPGDGPWADLLGSLSSLPAVRHVRLAGLPPSALEAWLVERATRSPDAAGSHSSAPDRARWLHRKTAGLPFFVDALLNEFSDAWIDSPDRHPLDPTVPSSLVDPLNLRLDRLPPERLAELEIAALLGSRFTVERASAVLREVAGRADWRLDERSSRAIVRAIDDQPGWYRFEHDLLRDAVLARIDPNRRRELAAAAAGALAALDADDSVIAAHLLRAVPLVDTRSAIDRAMAAAAGAYGRLALHEAEALYRSALALVPRLVPPDPGLQIDLTIGLALAMQRLGAHRQVLSMLGDTMELAESMGCADRMARVGNVVALFGPSVTANEVASSLVERALAGGGGSPEVRANLAADLVYRWSASDGRRAEAEALYAAEFEGVELSAQADLYRRQAELTLLSGLPNAGHRLVLAREMAQLSAPAPNDLPSIDWIDAIFCELAALLELGDADAVDAVFTTFRQATAVACDPYYEWLALTTTADLVLDRGEFDRAEGLANDAVDFGMRAGIDDAVQYFAGHHFVAAYLTGEMAPLLDELDVLEAADLERPVWKAVRAHCLRAASRSDEASELIAEAVAQLATDEVTMLHPVALSLAGQAVIDLGARHLAAPMLALIEPYSGLVQRVANVGASLGPADRVISGLLVLSGRTDEALERARAALTLAEQARSTVWIERCLVELERLDQRVT